MHAIPGMEPALEALCIETFGMEEGAETAEGTEEFGLVGGEPVHLRLFGSNSRSHNVVGVE